MEEKVLIRDVRVLSDNKYPLKEVTFSLNQGGAAGEEQKREVYERKNSATVLLYNSSAGTVILTRQFRLPTYLNGNAGGMMTECCAGVMDEDDAADCIRREITEETGYRVPDVEKIMEAYMTPASVTEMIHFFIAAYDSSMKVNEGGGLASEQEYIEVLELPFTEAYALIANGTVKDAKTIILLQYAQLKGLFSKSNI